MTKENTLDHLGKYWLVSQLFVTSLLVISAAAQGQVCCHTLARVVETKFQNHIYLFSAFRATKGTSRWQ